MTVPRLGSQVVRARSVRKVRATDMLSGLACIATRNPETIAAGEPSLAGPGGLKYGASDCSPGGSTASRCTTPDSGSVAHPATATSTATTRAASTGRGRR